MVIRLAHVLWYHLTDGMCVCCLAATWISCNIHLLWDTYNIYTTPNIGVLYIYIYNNNDNNGPLIPLYLQGRNDTSGGCRCRVNGKKCHPHCRNCHWSKTSMCTTCV